MLTFLSCFVYLAFVGLVVALALAEAILFIGAGAGAFVFTWVATILVVQETDCHVCIIG